MKDLFVLVADKNSHFAFKGAFEKPQRLGIRSISVEIDVHPNRDGGVRTTGSKLLKLRRHQFSQALLVFDYEGCGSDLSPHELEAELDGIIQKDWGDAGKAIVIEPELDVWMWGNDAVLKGLVGWTSPISIRDWLGSVGFDFRDDQKPSRPKEALEAVLREVRQPRSSSLYRRIAQTISLRRCGDAAFQRLRSQLVSWFPPTSD